MTTAVQTEWTERELLASEEVVEPLFAGGVRCHGGFDSEGRYLSPRTRNRFPAIAAWQAQRARDFGTPLLDVPLSSWPESYPNVAQAAFLISAGVPQPVISTLTRIGTVEGFGAMLRYSEIPDWQSCFVEDVRGTAIDHLDRGLFEAHARDEAGYGDEGGHKQMWFAARDVAFEHPVTEDQTQLMLQRMGLAQPAGGPGAGGGSGAGGGPGAGVPVRAVVPPRLFPELPEALETLLTRMAGLLLIEISAFHVFAWAEALLSDTELVAGDGEAGRLVSYIRSDETPHVEYLKTVLSEMRDRTFVEESGRKLPGTEVVGAVWERALADSLGVRREQNLTLTLREVEHALDGHPRRDDVLEGFHATGSIRPAPDGNGWVPVAAGT
ncbi:MAG TPA: hypothetical protein VFA94_14085 [Acidimicrobiales bacterium]|nr:hypothetical protein [Acidimicrobiales bacterium]